MLQQCESKNIFKVIDKHSDMIYKICFVYLKNKFDAEDAFQELVIKIMEKAPHFLNDDHEKAWIIKVSCNHCKNIIRLGKIKKHLMFIDDIACDQISFEDSTLENIMKLPLHYRKVLYLYYYEGYATKEIGALLNKRDATIRTWLKRAREKLKSVIGGDYSE